MLNVVRFTPFDHTLLPVEFPADEIFRGLLGGTAANGSHSVGSIRMDVSETDREYRVHAELPGVRKEDIAVSVEGKRVSLTAKVASETEKREGERVVRRERRFGQLERSFSVAHELDDSAAHARFADGILELTLPKKLAATARQLQIN